MTASRKHPHCAMAGLPGRVFLALILLIPVLAHAQSNSSVVNSPHNLSANSSSPIRAASEQEICIFCHTPHNSAPVQPLWNRNTPPAAYTPYTSNSLQALPGQPTGTSKLCLSCHDGTIALGSVLSRQQPIMMAGGVTSLPPGRKSNLGTDLSDDHPISFRYDQPLTTRNPKLKSPAALPSAVRLDAQQELQCTSCHDAHNDRYGNFLVMPNTNSQLCNSCHNQGNTDIAAHSQCASCHQSHTAPSGPYLLKSATVAAACTSCHSSAAVASQGKDIAADLLKISRHETTPSVSNPPSPSAVSCNDCHEPHTMLSQGATAPIISPRLGRIPGVDANGATSPRAQFEYEVCFKCHGQGASVQPRVPRQLVTNNTRLEFHPSAVSFHPVEAAGRNPDVPSLRTGLNTASRIYCSDCHNSDSSPAAGSTGPNGPHGSNEPPLLALRYDTTDNTAETANTYALCYKCHDRASILSDQSFPTHSLHVTTSQTPCSVCHDPHGVPSAQGTTANNSHLINFDTSVVQPDPVTHRLQYVNLGPRRGECYLTCHGVPHSPLPKPALQRAIRSSPLKLNPAHR